MNWQYKLLLTGVCAILLIDTLGSIASRLLDFNYVYLTPASFLVYATIGFIGTRKLSLIKGLLLVAIVGLFESVIGWQISILLHANTGKFSNEQPTLLLWILTVILSAITATLMGLIGCGIAKITKKKTAPLSDKQFN